MGFEAENEARLRDFANWRVDADMMRQAQPEAIFLYRLPAHRGEEVTAEVIDGPQSRVWDEAEKPPARAEGVDGVSGAWTCFWRRGKGEGRRVKPIPPRRPFILPPSLFPLLNWRIS